MQAAARDFLHDALQLFALTEHVEHRRDGAQFEWIRTEEHEVIEHAIQFGEQRPRPRRALRHLHAQHLLDGEGHADLTAERR